MDRKVVKKCRQAVKKVLTISLALMMMVLQFQIPVSASTSGSNLALNKAVSVSGVETDASGKPYPQFAGEKVVDGINSKDSRWSAAKEDAQWLQIDLGKSYKVNQITIAFHAEAPEYEVQISEDGVNFTPLLQEKGGSQGATIEKIVEAKGASARYVKYVQQKMWKHATNGKSYGSSIREIMVSEYFNYLITDDTLRVGTFNIAATKTPDIDEQRALTNQYQLELLGLQEVDRNTTRNPYDMLAKFADGVYDHQYYSKAIDVHEGEYGIGTLSRLPLEESSTTSVDTDGVNEARVYQRSVITKGDKKIAFYNTHLSFESMELKQKQYAQLKEAIKNDPIEYKVLVGDFNADQSHSEFTTFLESLDMVNGNNGVWHDTFNAVDATMKVNSVDNIIVSRNLHIDKVEMIKTNLSDHNLLTAQLRFLDAPQLSKAWLQATLEEANKIESIGYTQKSYEALQTQINASKNVYDTATTQQAIDDAANALITAIDNLKVYNLAKGKTVTYSGVEGGKNASGGWVNAKFAGEFTVDGINTDQSRWSAAKEDAQWLTIDLGEVKQISEVLLYFHASVPDYEVQLSEDGNTYTSVFHDDNAPHNETFMKQISFPKQSARYVKFVQNKQFQHTNGKKYGVSLREIEVYEEFAIDSISIDNATNELSMNEKYALETTILPELAANNKVSYTSSNPAVATIDQNGIMTGVSIGKTTITIADVNHPEVNKTMEVNVIEGPVKVSKFVFSDATKELTTRDKRTLTYHAYPSNASNLDEAVEWLSADANIVSVNDKGIIKANANGTTVVTVRSKANPAIKGEITIHVTEPTYSKSYDVMKDRWLRRVVGDDAMDMSDPDIKAYVEVIDKEGVALWASLHKEDNRTTLWDKLASDTVSADYTTQFTKIKKLALAFGVKGTTLYENEELRADIVEAIHFMVVNKKYNGTYSTGNWWDWQIGATQPLVDTLMILSDYCEYSDLELAVKSIEGYAKSPAIQWPNYTATGANRTDIGLSVLGSAILAKSDVRMELVKTLVPDVMKLVKSGDGLYADGSVIQHTKHAYTGSYGNELLKGVGRIQSIIAGSEFDITDERINNVYHTISEGYIPLMHDGQMMSMVNGRSISRAPGTNPFTTEFAAGSETISNIMLISQFAPETYRKEYRSAIKYWLDESKNDYEFFSNARDFDALLGAKEILNDTSNEAMDFAGMKVYGSMDRVVQANEAYTTGLSMYSSRIYNYEFGNTENKRGWHTGSGVLYVYNNDLKQYGEGYWPTIDPYRLPGTTVDTKHLDDGVGFNKTSPQSWVGGTSDGKNGAAGMFYNASNLGLEMDLKAQKSWFFLDGKVVALGSGITGTTDASIETTVENRMMDDTNKISVNGSPWDKDSDSQGFVKGNYVHFEGSGSGNDMGYYFLDKQKVTMSQETRTGTYSDINSYFVNDKTYENTFFKMGIDHGQKATDATYGYIVLPGYTQAQMNEFAQANDVEIIRNDKEVQAVKENNVFAMNVWQASGASVNAITIDNAASVFTTTTDGMMRITIADPTQKNVQIKLSLDDGYRSLVSKDDSVTINDDGSFQIDTTNSAGASHELVVELNVDTTALDSAIQAAKEIDENVYTTASYTVLKDAITHAETTLNDVNASQVTINEATKQVQEAITNLVKRADKTALQKLCDTYANIEKDAYTTQSWATFETALAKAKTILGDEAVTQETVDNMVIDLQNAFAALNKKPVSQTVTDEQGTISVSGSFDEGVTLSAKELSIEQIKKIIKDMNSLDGKSIERMFDLNLMKDDAIYQTDGSSMTIKIKLDAATMNKKLSVAYIKEDGTSQILPSVVENGFIIFETTHFSYYAILSDKITIPTPSPLPTPSPSPKPEAKEETVDVKKDETPNTGDHTSTTLWIMLLLAGGFVMVALQKTKEER